MIRSFVVITGLPGSGKTTVGCRLAAALHWPLIDKDEILERLFASKGIGDAEWRRRLSRDSDALLQREAAGVVCAVLVSFWHVPGMAPDSGTPTEWLQARLDRLVNVHCACDPEIAADRFVRRRRHPGHRDDRSNYPDIVGDFRRLAALEPVALGTRIDVDTSIEPDLESLVRRVRIELER